MLRDDSTIPSSTVVVETSDEFASLQVVDNTGDVLAAGLGNRLECSDLQPGFYRAQLLTPEGQLADELLELASGETKQVILQSPTSRSRLLEGVIESGNFTVLSDNSLEVSESVGPIATAQLSTVLTLAGSVATYEEAQLGAPRLRNLGLKAFRNAVPGEAESGLQILFGVESESESGAREFLSETRFRFWPFEEPVPDSFEEPIPFSAVGGLAEFASPALPGPYWLSVEIANGPPAVFALAMLPRRLTMLVFHRGVDGYIRTFQYFPSLRPDDPSLRPDDPQRPAMMRRLELIQRFYMNGRLDHAYHAAVDLLQAKWEEPMAGCLGGYLLLKLGEAERLSVPSENMMGLYEGLSDSHVLRAEYEASRGGHGDAESLYHTALDRGIPVFAEGLERLYYGADEYAVHHPRLALLDQVVENRIPGQLWSAWTPENLAPGIILDTAA